MRNAAIEIAHVMRAARVLSCALLAVAIPLTALAQGQAPKGNQNEKKMVRELMSDLGKTPKGSKERRAILVALEEQSPQNDQETKLLLDALDDDDPKVQMVAVKSFLHNKDKKAATKLLSKVKNIPTTVGDKMTPEEEETHRVSALAARALSGMKDKAALPIIVDKLGDAPFPAVYDEQMLSLSAVDYGSDVLPVVKKKIASVGQKNPYGKMRLLSVIMNIQDKTAAPELRKLFESDDPDLKSAAARGLRNVGEKVDVEGLFKTLDDLEKNRKHGKMWVESRSRVIDEIGFAGNPEAIPVLKNRIEAATKAGSGNAPCYAEILALARIGGQGSFSFLEKRYRNASDERFRGLLVDAFGQSRMKEAVPLLLEALNDQSASKQFRVSVAHNLGRITGEEQKYMRLGWEIMGWRK